MNKVLEFVASFQAVPACLKSPLVAIPVFVVLTLLLGRFFCRFMCPLGIIQTLVNLAFHPKSHVRRVCTRLPSSLAQKAVRGAVAAAFFVLLACGFTGVAAMVEPWSLFGKAIFLFVPGVVVIAAILVLAAFTKGRFWCNWICPAGTVFTILSRFSLRKDKVAKRCGSCRACFPKKGDEGDAKATDSAAEGGVTRRAAMQGVAFLAAEKISDGGFAPVTAPGVPERASRVLPPGAVDAATFATKCVGCQLCTAVCPGGCLKPSTKLSTFGQVELDFTGGYCRLACGYKCGKACPAGAIRPLGNVLRRDVHMGLAHVEKDICLRIAEDVKCTACERKCPVKAIKIVEGIPVVDATLCIGCGACEHVCPVRPLPAVRVDGFERQRIVSGMTEADLVDEMARCIAEGASSVVARDGVIVAKESGRGVAPLLKLHDMGLLKGAILADKVIGRAAAAIAVSGGVRKVWAALISDDAAELLAASGVEWAAKERVPRILNRDKSGMCPFEKAVEGLSDAGKMLEQTRKAVIR